MATAPNERALKLAQYVAAYIACDVKIHNSIRTPFDEIDALLREGPFLRPRSGRGHWLNKKNFRNPAIVDLVLNHFEYVSPAARTTLEEFRSNQFEGEIEVICEHVVPCSRLEVMLRDEHARSPLTADCVLTFHRRFYRRAVITRDEDRTLNSFRLRRRMPEGWNGETGCPFDRYRNANLDWARDWR